MADLSMRPIATLRTPFAEKFGIPRQSGLVEEAIGRVEFHDEFNRADFVRGLESFSHLWLVTVFHHSPPWEGRATVRPPRLGGSERVGVFASRSPHRPNPIGLSLVRLVAVETEPQLRLQVAGVDAVDGTPVLDIKPYLPWCESQPGATAAWADETPTMRPAEAVRIPQEIEMRILAAERGAEVLALIISVLRHDPQPAHHDPAGRIYGMSVAGWNVRWRMDGERVQVLDAELISGVARHIP